MAVLAVASAGIGAASSQQGPEPGMIAFTGVNVVSMKAGEGVAADQTALVGDGRIIAIGPASEVDVPPAATRVEAAGKYLMPELADMHVHLEYFDDPNLLRLFIANGVTLVRNMDGRPHVLEWRTQVESGELAGPTIYTAGPILDGDPPQRDDNTVVRDAAEARSAVLEQAARGYDFIKVYTNLSQDSYRAILETARDEGLPVAGDLPRDVDLRTALDAATREAARFLGRLDEFGTVEVGKRADLLLLDADPLEDVANVRRIAGVVVRGDWLPAGRLEAMLADLGN